MLLVLPFPVSYQIRFFGFMFFTPFLKCWERFTFCYKERSHTYLLAAWREYLSMLLCKCWQCFWGSRWGCQEQYSTVGLISVTHLRILTSIRLIYIERLESIFSIQSLTVLGTLLAVWECIIWRICWLWLHTKI